MRRVITGILLAATASSAAMAERLDSLPLLKDAYPRAFYFRQSEGLAAQTKLTYEDWLRQCSALDAIMGKCLNEEIPNRGLRNPDFFTRYKKGYPEKAVLLHFNGHARDPRYQTAPYFAGHWLYLNGCRLAEELPAESGISTVKVDDPTLFKTNMGRFNDKNEDLGFCMLDENGRPDWARSEQVELLGVDPAKKTITIQRGAFASVPRAFPKGRGYAAAHDVEGPWGKNSNLLWAYNLATTCPRDAAGKTCTDRLLDDLTRWFGEGGLLAAFDGVEFDVLHFYARGGGRGRGADVDADGIADAGIVAGVNAYGLGVHQFVKRLREAFGKDRLMTADGHSVNNQRSSGLLNGIESEGWPNLSDCALADWSGGLNRHAYWRDRAQTPTLNYINHKFMESGKPTQVPHAITRLVLAAAHFTDSAFTYSLLPPRKKGSRIGVWDELQKGQARQPRWLGKALGPARHLGFETPDLLNAAGLAATPAFLHRWQSEDGEITPAEKGIRIAGTSPNLTARCCSLLVPSEDLLVRFQIRAEPLPGYPAEIPRLVWLSCAPPGRLIRPHTPAVFIQLRNGEERAVTPGAGGATCRYFENRSIDGESHEAYLAHPPYGRDQGPGATIWQRQAVLPEGACALSFYTGLNAAPHPSDGVSFRVELDTATEKKTLFEAYQTDYAWIARHIDLSPWAGKTVILRFSTDCGPKDNTTADHAHWGDVYVTDGHATPHPTGTRRRIMTWAGEDPFEAIFYFRDAGPATVDLELDIEGAAPLYISGLRAYSAADTMARAYEGGLVIANPSKRPQPFDLHQLYSGATLRRLQGTPSQDPATNNGEIVESQLLLPPMDALFLATEPS